MENTFWNKLAELNNCTLTANGDFTYKSTLNGLMDLMFKSGVMKSYESVNDMIKLFNKAWNENPIYAIRLLFYIRDCRGGQGCKLFFRAVLVYLSKFQPNVAGYLYNYIPEYGCWSDIIEMLKLPSTVLPEKSRKELFTLIFKQLTEDIQNIEKNKSISLLMKWLPSENTSSKATVKLAKEIRNRLNITSCEYRKMLSSGRKYLDIVERKMCKNQFENINYSAVPSVAMNNYKDSFMRHDETRFTKYLDDVNTGKSKINASVLYPYDVIKNIIDDGGNVISWNNLDVPNAQWNALPDFFNQKSDNSLVVADVSGSMYGIPLKVCLSLAIYIAERNHGKFHNKFITFSANPELQTLIGKSLAEKCVNLSKAEWDMNTNLSKVFELLYNAVTPETAKDIPSSIYIISDMQFDQCVQDNNKGTYKHWRDKFKKDLNIELPKIIFWNVSQYYNDTVPVTVNDDTNTVLVSGFSPSIIKFIMNGATNTLQLIEDVVLSDRYKNIISEEQFKELLIS